MERRKNALQKLGFNMVNVIIGDGFYEYDTELTGGAKEFRRLRDSRLSDALGQATQLCNEYCKAIKSKVTFMGHIGDNVAHVYPLIGITDPMDASVGITSFGRDRMFAINVLLEKTGMEVRMERIDGDISFTLSIPDRKMKEMYDNTLGKEVKS